jgi:ppGpp synthetase/RelA/SpoT-type nucleotidyltranferase
VAAAGSYADVAEAYAAERDKYQRLAKLIAAAVEVDLHAQHLEVVVQHRAKDVRSFVKKALREGYSDPLGQIGDKAGVRVIVHYKADVPAVEKIVEAHCEVYERESKLDALAFDKLGYLGVHLGVTARTKLLGAKNADLAGLKAEVQIHTKAQSAWAVVSHDLLYKSALDVPSDLKRTITRLVALVELFDDEVARFQEQLRQHPDFAEMQTLQPLDDLFIEFTDHRPDKALSAMVVPPLVRLYGLDAAELVASVIRPFVEAHRAQLEAIYAQYAADERATPLLFQPEALLIFASLEEDAYRVREAWPSHVLPVDLLEAMANIWGIDLQDFDGT